MYVFSGVYKVLKIIYGISLLSQFKKQNLYYAFEQLCDIRNTNTVQLNFYKY